MTRKNAPSWIPLALAGIVMLFAGWAVAAPANSLETEKQKLEVERLKLENQRLQLEIETLKVKASETVVPAKESKKEGKERFVADRVSESEALAQEKADDPETLVFDFTNGQLWYKGVRANLNDFKDVAARQKWQADRKLINYNGRGQGRYLVSYENLSLLKYDGHEQGVFTWKAPKEGQPGFRFTSPEGVTEGDGFGKYRNGFENPYFTLQKEKTNKKRGIHTIRFRNKKVLSFSEILEFDFDDEDHLQEIRWGVLDEN